MTSRPAPDIQDGTAGREGHLFDEEIHLFQRSLGEDLLLVDWCACVEELLPRGLLAHDTSSVQAIDMSLCPAMKKSGGVHGAVPSEILNRRPRLFYLSARRPAGVSVSNSGLPGSPLAFIGAPGPHRAGRPSRSGSDMVQGDADQPLRWEAKEDSP